MKAEQEDTVEHAITDEILRSISLELGDEFDSHDVIFAIMRQYPREYLHYRPLWLCIEPRSHPQPACVDRSEVAQSRHVDADCEGQVAKRPRLGEHETRSGAEGREWPA
jgi:hypothetical protein